MQVSSKHVCALALTATIASSSAMFAQNAPPATGNLATGNAVIAPGVGAIQPAIAPKITPKPLTGKERLGEKWQDEQRIDNCNVPLDKRGTKPRPEACPPS
jgi:hypothetical protein